MRGQRTQEAVELKPGAITRRRRLDVAGRVDSTGGAAAQGADCSYQLRTRSARSVFQRLGRLSPSRGQSGRCRDGCSPAARRHRAAASIGANRSLRPCASPAHRRPSGSIRGHAARRSSSGWPTRRLSASSADRPDATCQGRRRSELRAASCRRHPSGRQDRRNAGRRAPRQRP